MKDGWIKIYRKMLDNPVICKDAEHVAVWIYLLSTATHQCKDVIFDGRRITLRPGQLITGRKVIATKFKIHESKIQRILKTFENEQQIEQLTSNRNRLISILNWDEYQCGEQPTEQQLNNKRTTTEQQLNTNKNERKKECKNKYKKPLTPKGELSKKKEDKIDLYLTLTPENWRLPVKNWLEYKRARGQLYKTEKSFSTFMKKIQEESGGNVSNFTDAVEQSIKNNWAGVFPKQKDKPEFTKFDNKKEYEQF